MEVMIEGLDKPTGLSPWNTRSLDIPLNTRLDLSLSLLFLLPVLPEGERSHLYWDISMPPTEVFDSQGPVP